MPSSSPISSPSSNRLTPVERKFFVRLVGMSGSGSRRYAPADYADEVSKMAKEGGDPAKIYPAIRSTHNELHPDNPLPPLASLLPT